MAYILSYDLGTGGTKASLYDEAGRSLASTFVSCDTLYPREQWHEQRPDDWWRSVVESTQSLLSSAPVDRSEIACLAVSGHSLGVTPVDAQGKLLTETTPIWSDGRADAQARRFFESVDERTWYLTTGNGFPAANYGIFKIMWLRDEHPDIYARTACFLGTKDYVNLRMTGAMVTDHSYASGSGVYSLRERRYVEEYIAAPKVDAAKLPRIVESAEVIGTLTPEAARLMGLPQGVRVAAGGVDNACIGAHAICGFCAAFAGMIMLANLGTGEPASGNGYELDAIAAAAIGGTRMSGGKGTVLGTFLGALLLAALKIGMIVIGVQSFWQFIVTGIIIVIAAYFETIQDKLAAMMFQRSSASAVAK